MRNYLAVSPFVGTRFQFCSGHNPTDVTDLMSHLKALTALLSIDRCVPKPLTMPPARGGGERQRSVNGAESYFHSKI